MLYKLNLSYLLLVGILPCVCLTSELNMSDSVPKDWLVQEPVL